MPPLLERGGGRGGRGKGGRGGGGGGRGRGEWDFGTLFRKGGIFRAISGIFHPSQGTTATRPPSRERSVLLLLLSL